MTTGEMSSGWDRRRALLLAEYERVAMMLFAERGFKTVTFDEIAADAGVSTRTLFRYFPTKEDALLGFPRRATTYVVELIHDLAPTHNPLETVWTLLRDLLVANPPDVARLNLWRRAAADAPEVVRQVVGERTQSLLDAVTAYCARCLEVDPTDDARPRVMAGVVVGVELAMIETIGRSTSSLDEILDAAERSIGVFERSAMSGGMRG